MNQPSAIHSDLPHLWIWENKKGRAYTRINQLGLKTDLEPEPTSDEEESDESEEESEEEESVES